MRRVLLGKILIETMFPIYLWAFPGRTRCEYVLFTVAFAVSTVHKRIGPKKRSGWSFIGRKLSEVTPSDDIHKHIGYSLERYCIYSHEQ
jgi:hypothetical protein